MAIRESVGHRRLKAPPLRPRVSRGQSVRGSTTTNITHQPRRRQSQRLASRPIESRLASGLAHPLNHRRLPTQDARILQSAACCRCDCYGPFGPWELGVLEAKLSAVSKIFHGRVSCGRGYALLHCRDSGSVLYACICHLRLRVLGTRFTIPSQIALRTRRVQLSVYNMLRRNQNDRESRSNRDAKTQRVTSMPSRVHPDTEAVITIAMQRKRAGM